MAAELPLFFDAGGGKKFHPFLNGFLLALLRFGEVEHQAVPLLLFAGVAATGVVEADGGNAQHGGLRGHGCAFAIEQGGGGDGIVHLFGGDLQAVGLEIIR